jgi:hypothetical protein
MISTRALGASQQIAILPMAAALFPDLPRTSRERLRVKSLTSAVQSWRREACLAGCWS